MKILIVNPFGIGDVLFTAPIIRLLTEKGDSVYFWSNERVADILRYDPAVKGILPISRGDLKKYFNISITKGIKAFLAPTKWLRKERFDIALDFSLDYRYSLLLWLLGVKRRIGFDYKGRGRFLTDSVRIEGFAGKHIVEHYAELLKFIDKSLESKGRMELFVGSEDSKWADRFLKENGINETHVLIGITPGGGASWGKDAFRKHWPKEKFAHVADKLAFEYGYKILIFGSEKESLLCASVAKKMKNCPLNTGGRLSLGRFAALLKKCKLLITNDGGPLHMAVALGVPTVSIFGPVDEKVYGPYPASQKHVVISGAAECRPCYKNFRYPLCETFICLDSIEPERVLAAAKKILESI